MRTALLSCCLMEGTRSGLKFMSSPSLSDLGKREPAAAAADERGTQQRRACANATWNRQLLKTELGSFFTEYLQNQLLTKGMVILRDKIRFYEEAAGLTGRDVGLLLQRRAAHTAGYFLPRAGQGAVGPPAGPAALPGHHHPQREAGGRADPHPRPRACRHRADAAGPAGRARVPGRDQGLPAPGDADPEEQHLLRRSRSGDVLAKNPVVRSKSYNTPLLNPVAEHEAEGSATGATGVRRHSVSEMTSCPDGPGQGPTGDFGPSPGPQAGPCPSRLYPPTQPPEPGPGLAHGSPPSSSPENLVDHILESADSDSEGIFIDFGRRGGSGASQFEGPGGRQSIV
ncbi:proline-rich protein 5 isoform X6 [Pteropus medius]|uniref:proline-rich protein 5 isoform X6 n=1 Tax=Pteropus vampyrus TaxID=132908 RepID=UPI00196BAF77|nr:proline-rich protein 5 isoform X6 [Pteropus giganteus]